MMEKSSAYAHAWQAVRVYVHSHLFVTLPSDAEYLQKGAGSLEVAPPWRLASPDNLCAAPPQFSATADLS